jgi:hypothetical protein
MKAIIVIIICIAISSYAFAEIKNGYKQDVYKAKQTLKNLKIVMDDVIDNEDLFTPVKTRYILVKVELNFLLKFFSITNELINNLQIIHPDLFDEINYVQDHHGNETDVYIRVQPDEHMNKFHWGTTNLRQAEGDPHTYQSYYGPGSVAVNIRLCLKKMSLKLLVHELGHVKYQVPNLASYLNYFKENYKFSTSKTASGHKYGDPSNQSVIAELQRFNNLYRERKHLLKSRKIQKNGSKTEIFLTETKLALIDHY